MRDGDIIMPYKNREERLACQKRYRDKNKEKAHLYYLTVIKPSLALRKNEINLYNRQYRQKNLDSERAKERLYYHINKQKILVRKRLNNKTDSRKESRRNYENKRYHTDIHYRLAKLTRNRIRKALKHSKKLYKFRQYLGGTVEDLKVHLEKQFKSGMSWDNFGFGFDKWSVDHIIPLSAVDLTNEKEFLKVCNYKNLQPMWCTENFSKGNRYEF